MRRMEQSFRALNRTALSESTGSCDSVTPAKIRNFNCSHQDHVSPTPPDSRPQGQVALEPGAFGGLN